MSGSAVLTLSPKARVFALLVSLLAFAALALQLHVGLTRHPDRPVLVELWRMGRYFTILTNTMLAIDMARISITGRAGSGWLAALTLWIAIVGVVYHTLLARELSGLRWLADFGLHTVVPLAMAVWWASFAPKAGLRWRHAALWLIWPGLYFSYVLIRGEVDGRHPYFFIDPPRIGWPMVMAWSAALTLVFYLSGLVMVALGRWMGRTRTGDRETPDQVRGGAA